jgi:hypothetical protein
MKPIKHVYVMVLITPDFTAQRIFENAATALREASKTRKNYNAVAWLETTHGHVSASGSIKLTVKAVTLE